MLPPIALKGDIAVGRVRDTELLVKLPVVASDQYSVWLIEARVILSGVPPQFELNASACAVTVPAPVVG